jgi:RNA polymerase sigma factor (sigma-70 family)
MQIRWFPWMQTGTANFMNDRVAKKSVSKRQLHASLEPRWRLFEAQRNGLERLIRRAVRSPEDTADLLQEIAVILLRHDKVPDDELAFAAWCRAVARHVLMHHFRDASRRREFFVPSDADTLEEVCDPRLNAERVVLLRDVILKASDSLADSGCELIAFRYVYEENANEIGTRINEAPANVRVRLSRTRALLRKRVQELDEVTELRSKVSLAASTTGQPTAELQKCLLSNESPPASQPSEPGAWLSVWVAGCTLSLCIAFVQQPIPAVRRQSNIAAVASTTAATKRLVSALS